MEAIDLKVTCINDAERPNEVRITNWIKKGNDYTPIKIVKSKLSGDRFFVLEEVQPDAPYGGYNINRFALSQDTINQIEEMIKTGELIEELV